MIVTGSSKDIKAGVAECLAIEDVSIIVNQPCSAEKAELLVNRIVTSDGKAFAVRADMSKSAEVQPLIDAARMQFGKLDILENNAGVHKSDFIETLIAKSFDEHFNQRSRSALQHRSDSARSVVARGNSQYQFRPR